MSAALRGASDPSSYPAHGGKAAELYFKIKSQWFPAHMSRGHGGGHLLFTAISQFVGNSYGEGEYILRSTTG